MSAMKIGIIGCGNVLEQYLDRAGIHSEFEVVALADLNHEAAKAQAERYNIGKVSDPQALIADPEVELVVNFTPPVVHADVTLEAIAAGKHVFTEKPFATTLKLADEIVRAAREANVSVACAPATFLGGGMQTSRKLIDDGWIGEPVAAFASFTCRGYEHWHPNIDPFYSFGAGPMLDIGPYLITNLINFLGPARRVSASAHRSSDTRFRPNAKEGQGDINIEVPTHIAGTVDFESGAVATVVTSWDMWSASLPQVEIYGTKGTLSAPNPDHFTGMPVLRRGEERDLSIDLYPPRGGDWRQMPMTHRGDAGRAIGLADTAYAIRNGQATRAGMEFAYHALEIMLAFEESSERGEHVEITSTCQRPAPLVPIGADEPYRFD
jgi:predicted dehydrogenase